MKPSGRAVPTPAVGYAVVLSDLELAITQRCYWSVEFSAAMAKKSHTIRFGLGDPTGWHSATWRVWHSGRGRDLYLANRYPDIGAKIKQSFHGNLWRFAVTKEAAAAGFPVPEPGSGLGPRAFAEWKFRPEAAPPAVEAFVVVLGRFSLAWEPTRETTPVDWVGDLPGIGEAWRFVIMITDAGFELLDDPRITLAGKVTLADGAIAWVARYKAPITAEITREIDQWALGAPATMLATPGEQSAVCRGHSVHGPGPEGAGALVDLGVSRTLPPESQPCPAGIFFLDTALPPERRPPPGARAIYTTTRETSLPGT
ncbi:hypothetical protein BH24ACT7_BH24ACT7_26200 [soil metagenome]